MAKEFYTTGTGSGQVLHESPTEKIPIYDSKAAAEADIANIEEGGIVATKDTGATEKVVDVVQDGNMNPVTSNGVFDYLGNFNGMKNTVDIATENQMRALFNENKNAQLVKITQNITPVGESISIPAGTEGIFYASTSDRHFIGMYYNGIIYSWFMNSNGTNVIRSIG